MSAGILARDGSGTEHLLIVVDHPAGLCSISDDEVVRILTPAATVALILELVHRLGAYAPVRPGGIGGGRP
jgi:hypothetical protein